MPNSEAHILVVGAGSAGSRHAQNLQRAGADVDMMDPDSERAASVPGARAVAFDLGRLEGYDGIVIASPTIHHQAQLIEALKTRARVLVEKPLATDTEGLDDLVRLGQGRVMVGYNLRLHEPVEQFMAWLHEGRAGRPLTARVWFGYHLPSWRPGVDYRTTYSAQAALGGGVLLDAIHELDLLVWMFDEPFEVIGAALDRLGGLEIDVEDTVRALLRHPSGVVADLSLDYLSRRYRRGLEVVGEEATLRLDWARGQLELESETDVETRPATTSIERSYEREVAAFLDFVRGDGAPPVDVRAGAASVRLADQIRRAGAR